MSDFYEPTLLFRQNAIKRYSPLLSPIASVSTLDVASSCASSYLSSAGASLNGPWNGYTHSSNTSSSWLLNQHNPKDTEVLNKVCSLDRLNIKSNYWKIPDTNMNLTSLAINKQETDHPLLAISSGNRDNNMFIYELDVINNYLTHHNTISLPNIHAMKWVPDQRNNHSKFLVAGNNKGYAHLVSVPSPDKYSSYTLDDDDEQESAEIIKRFNHRKHLKSINKDPSILAHKQTNITKLGFSSQNQNLFSIYDDNLFYWNMKDVESSAKPRPIMISSINGLSNFDITETSEAVIGICGNFGVSLFDTRDPKFSVPSSVVKEANRRKLSANIMKWCDTNTYVFAAGHVDGNIRLWDIRKQESFACLSGHQSHGEEVQVTNLEWNNQDLFSGASDGNIIHWDLSSDVDTSSGGEDFSNDPNLKRCGLKEGLNSVRFDPKKNSLSKALQERQCGTMLPASNTKIVGMGSVKGSDSDDLKILSIDGSSFFGVHSKIYEAVHINLFDDTSDKLYYTKEDMALIKNECSESTLMAQNSTESVDEVTKPLAISRRPTVVSIGHGQNNNSNTGSEDTLLEAENAGQEQLGSYKMDFNVDSFDHSQDVIVIDEINETQIPSENCSDHDDIASQDFTFTASKSQLYELQQNNSAYSVDSHDGKPLNSQDYKSRSPVTSTDESCDFAVNDSEPESLSTNPTVIELDSVEANEPKGQHENNHDDLINLGVDFNLMAINFGEEDKDLSSGDYASDEFTFGQGHIFHNLAGMKRRTPTSGGAGSIKRSQTMISSSSSVYSS